MPTRMRKGNAIEETELLEALLANPGRLERDRLFRAFVRRYERLIRSCILKAGRRYGAVFGAEDLADLEGEVWLTLLRDDMRKLRQYDAERGFRIASFVAMVAGHIAIDRLRGRHRVVSEPADLDDATAELPDDAADPIDLIAAREEARLAQEALDRLSREERRFVVEAFHDERDPAELARRLGVATNTVYSRKFKLQAKLRRIVEELRAA